MRTLSTGNMCKERQRWRLRPEVRSVVSRVHAVADCRRRQVEHKLWMVSQGYVDHWTSLISSTHLHTTYSSSRPSASSATYSVMFLHLYYNNQTVCDFLSVSRVRSEIHRPQSHDCEATITQSTILLSHNSAKLTYALPAYAVQLTVNDKNRINAISRKAMRRGLTLTLILIAVYLNMCNSLTITYIYFPSNILYILCFISRALYFVYFCLFCLTVKCATVILSIKNATYLLKIKRH